ncbi:hypothetical protein ABZV67_14140 [Streptomyces sp. NPDC005065]
MAENGESTEANEDVETATESLIEIRMLDKIETIQNKDQSH